MIVSVFRDLYKSTDVPFHVPLDKIIKRIKAGTSKELVEAVRNGNSDKKKKLPSILFAGTFTERNSSSLQKHSGLMVVDFDKYPNEKTMFEQLELLKQNPHFVLLFISPSGKGIKGVIKVSDQLTKETHPKVFKEFYKKFEYEYFDIVNSDICRICFESYDPNIYVNMDAQIFEPILKDEGFNVSERTPLVPITDQDKGNKMATIIVDGLSVDTTEQGAQAINKLLADRAAANTALDAANSSHKIALDAANTEIGKLTAEIQTLKDGALKPADIDKLVTERSDVLAVVKNLDAAFVSDGKSISDLKRHAISKAFPNLDTKGKEDAFIDGVYSTIPKENPIKTALRPGPENDPVSDADTNTVDAAYNKYMADMQSAWNK